MAPKKKRPHSPDRDGIFHGMVVFLVPKGIQLRRLQVWKQKLEQMSATIEDQLSERVTHIFAADLNVPFQQVNREHLKHFKGADAFQLSSLYNPPNLNKNITEIFDKLINIYRALGDDRRSFSYYKAISVVEKLPFKIENVHQVKDLPAIGKSMQDHIHEIVTSGRLSKLEHFEQDEKAMCVPLHCLERFEELVRQLH